MLTRFCALHESFARKSRIDLKRSLNALHAVGKTTQGLSLIAQPLLESMGLIRGQDVYLAFLVFWSEQQGGSVSKHKLFLWTACVQKDCQRIAWEFCYTARQQREKLPDLMKRREKSPLPQLRSIIVSPHAGCM